MEKSIELLWKDGFLKEDALVSPKINNLYNAKSIHIIEQVKRMFRINLIAIVAFSILFLGISFFIGIPITGILFFVMLSGIAYLNRQLFIDLNQLNLGKSCYEYLQSFNQWKNKLIALNARISQFLYPCIFLSMILGFGFKDINGLTLGERLIDKILQKFPDTYVLLGIPLFGILAVLFIIGILAYFGGRIYQWDLNLVYGRIFKKIEELKTDIEELNK